MFNVCLHLRYSICLSLCTTSSQHCCLDWEQVETRLSGEWCWDRPETYWGPYTSVISAALKVTSNPILLSIWQTSCSEEELVSSTSTPFLCSVWLLLLFGDAFLKLFLYSGQSLCSAPVCEASLNPTEQKLVLVDEGECVKKCGPLNISLAASACRAKHHAAIKTVRIPQISDLRALIEDPKLNLKVKKLQLI